jgi:hypothetical protein
MADDGLSDVDYLLHTRHPRFVCEVHDISDEVPEIDTLENADDPLAVGLLVGGFFERNGERVWCSNAGVMFARWAWVDGVASDAELHAAFCAAAHDRQLYDDAYGVGPGFDG